MSKSDDKKSPARTTSNAVTLPGNPWSQLATELEKFVGVPFVKFTKNGEFALSETDNIPDGTRCIARVDLTQTGWVRWSGGTITQRVMGAVGEGFVPPPREELGDTDKNHWDRDTKTGEPRDPWQFQMSMPITRLDTDETYSFTAGSKGGLSALNKLVRVFSTRIDRGKTGLPIVELRADFYKHHEYGKIYYPKFMITNWTNKDGTPLNVEQDLEDALPF